MIKKSMPDMVFFWNDEVVCPDDADEESEESEQKRE